MDTSPSRRTVLQTIAASAVGSILLPSMTPTPTRAAALPSQRLPRARPDELGVDPAGILAFLTAIQSKGPAPHSMMLLRRGKVVAEGWWNPYAPEIPHTLYSLSKSFTSHAVGLAVSDGLLKTTDKVVSFFPGKLPTTISQNLAAISVHNLLTMSTGHDLEPDTIGDDWVRTFLAAPIKHTPGTHFLYNTAATHVLAAIVEQLTKQSLTAYLTPRLFEPLGILNPKWQTAPSGVTIGGYGLSLRTEDIAAFGQLYLQRGRWNDKQLIPESWIDLATAKQVSNGHPATGNDWNQGYGYQFWRSAHDNYRGDGAFGQYCIVIPKHDAVLAMTSGASDMAMLLTAAWDHLLPAFDRAPSATPQAAAAALSSLEFPHPTGNHTSPLAKQISGKTWRFQPNDDKYTALTLTFGPKSCQFSLAGTHGNLSADVGYQSWIRGVSPFQTGPRPAHLRTTWSSDPVAMSGAWTDESTFRVMACFYESPYVLTLDLSFRDNELAVIRRYNVYFGASERPTLIAHG